VAAAESLGDLLLVRRAAFELGADDTAEDAGGRERPGRASTGVEFRHPLVRAAVYGARRGRGGARFTRRSLGSSIELILIVGSATSPRPRGKRTKNWRASWRGGRTAPRVAAATQAQASFMLEAAKVSPAPGEQARRVLRAATAALNAGCRTGPKRCLSRSARFDGSSARDGGNAARRPRSCAARGSGSAAGSSVRRRPAHSNQSTQLGPRGVSRSARPCVISQYFTTGVSPRRSARGTRTRRASTSPPTLSDLLLDGTALLFVSDFTHAMPLLRRWPARCVTADSS